MMRAKLLSSFYYTSNNRLILAVIYQEVVLIQRVNIHTIFNYHGPVIHNKSLYDRKYMGITFSAILENWKLNNCPQMN